MYSYFRTRQIAISGQDNMAHYMKLPANNMELDGVTWSFTGLQDFSLILCKIWDHQCVADL